MESVHNLIPLQVNIGGQLADHEIIGRNATVKEMLGYLDRGMNLTINDPRRIGKSASLQLLEATSTKKRTIVMTSVQPVHRLDQFLLHLLQLLHEHQSMGRRVSKTIGEYIDGTGVGMEVGDIPYSVSLRRNHQHKTTLTLLREMVSAINGALNDDEMLVLAIDEFTEAILNIASTPDVGAAEATKLLQTLQMLRKENPRVRWILTGSIGMHHAIRQTNCTSSVVNGDCKNVPVGPLSLEDAEHLSRCLALGEGIELTDDAHSLLASAVDGIPILVHAVIDDLRKQQTKTFDADAIESALHRYINDKDEARTFEHFVTRLATYYSAEELATARAILDRSASRRKPYKAAKLIDFVSDRLNVDEEQVRVVLAMIEDDHYLTNIDGRMSWRYPILARVWRAKRGLN